MKVTVEMNKKDFGVYDIDLGEFLDKHEAYKIMSSDTDVSVLMGLYDRCIFPTEEVKRDYIEMMLEQAQLGGMRYAENFGIEEVQNTTLAVAMRYLIERGIITKGQGDKMCIAIKKELL